MDPDVDTAQGWVRLIDQVLDWPPAAAHATDCLAVKLRNSKGSEVTLALPRSRHFFRQAYEFLIAINQCTWHPFAVVSFPGEVQAPLVKSARGYRIGLVRAPTDRFFSDVLPILGNGQPLAAYLAWTSGTAGDQFYLSIAAATFIVRLYRLDPRGDATARSRMEICDLSDAPLPLSAYSLGSMEVDADFLQRVCSRRACEFNCCIPPQLLGLAACGAAAYLHFSDWRGEPLSGAIMTEMFMPDRQL